MSRAAAPALLLALLSCAGTGPPVHGETLPGAAPLPPEVTAQFATRLKDLGPAYQPRTRHLLPDGSARYTNRLLLSSSPYLLQHAHNPVNWYPWGDEAFETAKRLKRPVLLSIGYSTCHWCHVMEEESFEDEEIARVMNEQYVAIKVDREERPDVDAIYMTAVQALTGGGGWPMTVWLTSGREPFHGATYIPARDGDRGVRSGFLTLLRRLRELHDRDPDRVAHSAAGLTREVQRRLAPPARGSKPPGASVLQAAAAAFVSRFDAQNGGLRGAPKFPSSLPVRFLLRHARRFDDTESLRMAALTLERMAASGMRDQVAGGFHRYATDERWLVPHFEKMLYDNALLAVAYLEGYQATGRAEFADVARDILRYVERDMTAPDGGFYSATDADSPNPDGHREEGYFFTWTPQELKAALGEEQARSLSAFYGVTPQGNFEGRSILHVPAPLATVAEGLGLTPDRLRSILATGRETLYQARARRPAPLRDEKILTAWNGLMIGAFARAALVLGEAPLARTAARAADFLLRNRARDGRLLRSFAAGQARHNGYLDDYAFFMAGLLDLFEVTGEARWLEEAIALDRVLEKHFEDGERGGFFLTSDDHEPLLAREKPGTDGAEPSGNSVAILNLLRLGELTTDDRYRRRADRALGAFQGMLDQAPEALSEMLLAVDFRLASPREIVIVTAGATSEAEPLLAVLRRQFLPNRVLAVVAEGPRLTAVAKTVPLVREKVAREGRPTAYVCEQGLCALPTTDPEVFARQLLAVGAAAPGGVRSRGTSR